MKLQRNIIIMTIGYTFWLIFSILFTMNLGDEHIPLLNLSEKFFVIFTYILWPLIASSLFMMLGMYGVSKIFMLKLIKFSKEEKLAFINVPTNELKIKTIVKRFFSLFLLTLGIADVLLASKIILPESFTTASHMIGWTDAGINPIYTPGVISQTLCLIIPIAFGIWSISWSIEDAGLIQYNLPKNTTEVSLYSIQPAYKTLNDYISGYGGISSILFYLSAFFYFFTEYSHIGGNFADLIFLFVIFLISLSITPIYMIYAKLSKTFLQKSLSQAPIITNSWEIYKESNNQ